MVLQDLEQARWFLEEIQPHEVALRKYLRAHFPQIRDIDDVVQETFNRLLLAHRSIQIDKPRAYLFRIARNVAVDLYRRHEIISVENLGDFESCDVIEDSRPNPAECAINDDDLSKVELAYAWAFSRPAISSVLIGARWTFHIDQALAARKIDAGAVFPGEGSLT